MTFHAALFDGKLGYTGQDARQLVSALLGDLQGVFSKSAGNSAYADLQVASGGGSALTISQGRGTVLNTYQATQGGLWLVRNDGLVTVSVTANASGNARWDAVGVRVYDSETGGDSSDIAQPLIQPGTPSGSASFAASSWRWNPLTTNLAGAPGQSGGPALQNNFLTLAYVLVPNGFPGSGSLSIFDYRMFITGGVQDTNWAPLALATNVVAPSGVPVGAVRQLGDKILFGGSISFQTDFAAQTLVATLPGWVPNVGQEGWLVGTFDASSGSIEQTVGIQLFSSSPMKIRTFNISQTTTDEVMSLSGLYFDIGRS